jgi:predicted lipoprotein
MLSNPVFAIIALLVLCGAAVMIETQHRILIVAPESAETAADRYVDRPDETIFAPASAPTFAPADPPHVTTDE